MGAWWVMLQSDTGWRAHGQAMPILGGRLAEKGGTDLQIWTRNHGICGHETISAASRHLNILCCRVILAGVDSWVPGHANFEKAGLAERRIWTRNHGICGRVTISAASRPLNILHMGLMNDAAEWYSLVIQWMPGHANFGRVKGCKGLHWSAHLDKKSWHLCFRETISAASRPLNILHMGQMNDDAEWYWLVMAHWCQAMPIWNRIWLKIGTDQQIWTRNHGICGHETISSASRPLNILHMDLMNDDAEWYWLMIAHGCQAMPILRQQLAEKLALIITSGQEIVAFVVLKPYQCQLPPSDPWY
jgi:hypothetical protein